MTREQIKLRRARLALDVAAGSDVLTVAAKHCVAETTVYAACREFNIVPDVPATCGRKQMYVKSKPVELFEVLAVLEAVIDHGDTEFWSRQHILKMHELTQRLSARVMAAGKA